MKYYDTPKERFQEKKRMESPSPGAYADEEAFKKTQMKRLGSVISKYELPRASGEWECESDMKVKEKKYLPGVGHYDYEKAITKLSRSPPPKRRK